MRYDTVYLRVLKNWPDDQLSLAHGTETKNIRKTKNENQVAQKEWSKQ